MPRVLVSAWIGSTNLGDEMVYAGLRHHLEALGVEAAGSLRGADGVLLGGGGLLQDETSPFNLPYHLKQPLLGVLRGLPYAGIGLGVGRLVSTAGRAQVRFALRRAVAVSVRDQPSGDLLASIGVSGAVVTADLALALPAVDVAPRDELAVCLRPWTGRRGWLPVALSPGRRRPPAEETLRATAASLDDAARATGLGVRLVSVQADRDDPLHRLIAARMSSQVETVTPATPAELLAEVGRARAVVATRYHGGIAAVMNARPAVLIGYSPKVTALAAELGAAGRALAWRAAGPEGVAEALAAVLGHAGEMPGQRERLKAREAGNAHIIERLLAAASGRS